MEHKKTPLDISEFFDIADDLQYVNFSDYGSRYGRLKAYLSAINLIDPARTRLHELAPPDTQWEHAQDLDDRPNVDDYYLTLEMGLNFLERIRDRPEPGKIAMYLSHSVSYERDIASAVSKLHPLFVKPLVDFLKSKCKDLFRFRDGAFGFDPQYVIEQVNEDIKQQGYLLIRPKYFECRDFQENEKMFFVIGKFHRLFNEGLFDQLRQLEEHVFLKPWSIKLQTANQPTTNPIMQDIWRSLCSCQGVIVDLRTDNFNVAYEMGIAHTLGKSVVVLVEEGHVPDLSKLPFDVSHWRCIPYKSKVEGDVLEALAQVIIQMLAVEQESPKTGYTVNAT